MRLSLLGIGLLIIFIGFALVMLGSITSTTPTPSTSTTSSAVGGFILIGPFPIFFGYGNTSLFFPMIIFGIIFAIIAIIFYIFTYYMFKKSQEGKI
ncbi:DUF131 domain-containing protein [Acidianus sulfidivorans JP7]|uniref:DUF131 domain-containing protein n=1 Tax=Acidianus sulfidivorans JP7 TaxID=619593 RepID=A0A2U9IMI3_9CREN|nr:DUF131 domain-containing protein [Acidianus sulfidivorans]AWR97134.1 DUF131 domain-containing protein [Acidianus sulfidivorans JP7]